MKLCREFLPHQRSLRTFCEWCQEDSFKWNSFFFNITISFSISILWKILYLELKNIWFIIWWNILYLNPIGFKFSSWIILYISLLMIKETNHCKKCKWLHSFSIMPSNQTCATKIGYQNMQYGTAFKNLWEHVWENDGTSTTV